MANTTSENSVDGKKMTELKVVELSSELEKRGLDKTGVKAVLMERLEKALESEGKIPGDYLFAESELKSKISSGHLSKGEMEKEMKDDEEDEETSLATSEECTDQNGSTNVKSNLKNENSDKIMDIALTVDNVDKVKSDVQDVITNETQQPSQMPERFSNSNVDPTSQFDKIGHKVNSLALESEGKITEGVMKKEMKDDEVETNEISTDPSALPPQSTSSAAAADANTKEEDVQNDADKSTMASTQDHSAPANLNEVKEEKVGKDEEESQNAIYDILPPTPTSVPCVAPLTLTDTINMDTSTAQQKEENESLIVHVDDTQNDLDADLVTSQKNGLKLIQAAKEKTVGKSEGKKCDVSSSGNPLEVGGESSAGGTEAGGMGGEVDGGGDKGNTEVKTEKEADEKKDDKDGKLKSAPSVSKFKPGGQDSRDLWISNLSPHTEVADLKVLFSKYGKVKVVVTNAHSLGAQRYVSLTMSTAKQASKCIKHLNQTVLHGRMISVERSKNYLGTQTAEKSDVKKNSGCPNSQNLWIGGLSSNTQVTDLEGLFSKYGKVIGAKLVTSGRNRKPQCYGFIAMSSAEEASKCLQHLNQTELHGRMISVERAKNELGTVKKLESIPVEEKLEKPEVTNEDKSRVVVMDKSKGEPVISVKRGSKESRDKVKISTSKEKVSTAQVKSQTKETTSEGVKDKSKESKDVLSFNQIKAQNKKKRREKKRQRIRELDHARLIQRNVERRQKEEAIRLERVRERLRMERVKVERERLERERIKLECEYLERERIREKIRDEQWRAEMLRFKEQRRAMKRSYERSDVQEEGFWNEAKRPNLNTPSSRFEHSFSSNESRFNEFEHRDYERRVERYDRRDARSIDTAAATAARFEERKDRDLARRDIGPVREIRDRDDRRLDERNHLNDRFDRREVGPSRNQNSDWSHETNRRDLGPDRGRDFDRRNVSAHDRLGRARNSPAVPPPDQRWPWGSGIEKKVDTWSHPHSNMDNGNVNRPNDRWMNNNIIPNHDRGAGSGGFVGGNGGNGGPGARGMVQNMGPGNMFVNPQTQPANMMVGGGGGGGNNIEGRIQEILFDAYKHMRRY